MWAGWSAGGLVVAGGVEDEFAEDLAGDGVHDGDAEVLDQESDVGSGVGPAHSDVVQSAVVAQGQVPDLSTLSVRTRSWVSALRSLPGAAFGRLS